MSGATRVRERHARAQKASHVNGTHDIAGGTPTGLPAGLTVVDGAQRGAWDEAMATALADVKMRLGAASSGDRRPLFLDATELFRREYPATPWLVTGLVTRGGVTVVGGEPKTCKTWLALDLAVAIATGTKACGEFFAERGRVAYFFAEDLDKQVRNRVRALLAGRGVESLPIGRLNVCPRGQFVDVLRDEDLAWIVASCRQLEQLDLLALDPLRDIHTGEEDKSDGMSPVMRRLRLLGEMLGCTVLVTHHNAKATTDTAKRRAGQRGRGSSVIHGSTDSGIYIGSHAGSDARGRFRNTVDVEIKGARSAGRRVVELVIADDDQGEAIRADWSVDACEPSGDATTTMDAHDDAAVFKRAVELFAASEWALLSQRQLRGSVPGVPDKRVRASLARLLGSKLALADKVDSANKLHKDRVVPK